MVRWFTPKRATSDTTHSLYFLAPSPYPPICYTSLNSFQEPPTMPHNRFTRRYFLKATATTAAAAVAFPQIIPARAFGASNRLNVALFGAGNRMRQILPSIIEGGTNVVAMCDVDPEQIVLTKSG